MFTTGAWRGATLIRCSYALSGIAGTALLGGCGAVVLDPAGDVALQQRNLLFFALALMLLIIVPVMVATMVFAWRYRASAEGRGYDPHFDHSTSLELLIWSAPLLIIIALGAVTWSSTHLLDPYRPLDRLAAGAALTPKVRPLNVQVVALDWKWLFIYPDLHIATVNELAVPVNVPVRFSITSTSMMNAFSAPTMAGMIYAMPGMQTTLNAVLNKPVESVGFSSNYSGAGFSDMRFKLHGLNQTGFDRWVAGVRRGGGALVQANYLKLQQPSEKVPVMRFAAVEPTLFYRIVNRCIAAGKPCMADVMARDARANGVDRLPGSFVPTNEAATLGGAKPKGALMRKPEDKGAPPHDSKPRQQGAPGSNAPGAERNRDLTMILTSTPAQG